MSSVTIELFSPSVGGTVRLEPLLFLNIGCNALDVGVTIGGGLVHNLHHPVSLIEEDISTGEVFTNGEFAGLKSAVNAGKLRLELIARMLPSPRRYATSDSALNPARTGTVTRTPTGGAVSVPNEM